jgi:PAS domain S-box-containing protein
MDSRGIDLRRELGIAAALGRAIRPGGVGATPVAARRDGTRGLFLVEPAPNLIDGVLRPGAVVVFLSEATLRAAARNPAGLRFPPAARSSGDGARGDSVRDEFTVAGQQFAVVMPKESVSGPGAVLPWIILAGGLLLAALAGALGVIAGRRARAQQDFDRIFNLSPDLVAVANFDGHFTRVNPAAGQILGYTEEELLTRPYLDLVHPDDRERTAAEDAAIGEGKTTLSFENRYARKDGSYRVLEWTSTPVVEERATYAVARDVTERREAEAEVERLAEEQAALRRVATLVAERATPAAVFDAVVGEMDALLDADQVALNRFEPGDEILVLAHRGLDMAGMPVGSRVSIEGASATAEVRRTGRPARMENYGGAQGPLAELARATGLRASVSAPIVVESRLWGLITASWKGEESPPPETEQRMSQFAQLLETAIANAEARAELMASRARLVAASDEARRRFERDLHDGIQQRLVSLSLELRGATAMGPPDNEELTEQLTHVGKGLTEALDDLRELSRGIHPAVLSKGGLAPALKALARRSAVPVQLDLAIAERFAEHVEIGAYYVVSEALTNTAKHARASIVEVHARALDGVLELSIDDDGVGGANPGGGSGLTGLADRVEALGGTIWIGSPPGEGTSLRVELPLDAQ